MKRLMVAFCFLLVAAAVCRGGGATNGWVELRWTFPTNCVDGSPVIDLAGAKIYCGGFSSNYTRVVDFPGGTAGAEGSGVVSNLVPGKIYFFNGTCYNVAGLESDFCNEVMKRAKTGSKPKPVKDFRALK